jgi:GMP synthase-like glutamine amidotransferase
MARIHFLQHVPFETPGHLESIAEKDGHTITCTKMWTTRSLPEPDEADLFVVLGGPMNIYEYDRHPWLQAEKKYLENLIVRDAAILGICLGSQLLADALGCTVIKNQYKEIGWFPVKLNRQCGTAPLMKNIPATFIPFHWHGDTYPVPPGAMPLGSSEACDQQGFIFGDRIVGLQFHLEMTDRTLKNLVDACGDELVIDDYVQTADAIFEDAKQFLHPAQQYLEHLLANMLQTVG